MSPPPTALDEFLARHAGTTVVQPRMGFCALEAMADGLRQVRDLPFPTVGTITLDSFTRTGQTERAEQALRAGQPLNGFPLLAHPPEQVRAMLASVRTSDFVVQVRHGTPLPLAVFRGLAALGIDATEGGPISYCLPYGQVALQRCIAGWAQSCHVLAALADSGHSPHIESFGGCMMGQLGPPSLLVAITVLEAIFFEHHGLRSVSLSYAQGTSADQDAGALAALRRLAARHLAHRWHIIMYMYMGLFPRTRAGARRIIGACAGLAASAGCERLIVKTAAEAHQIPSIASNLEALRWAAADARPGRPYAGERAQEHEHAVFAEASALIDCVLDLSPDIDVALLRAFQRGVLDVPYCLHPDNRGKTRTRVDADGAVRWLDVGDMPLPPAAARGQVFTASGLLAALSFHRDALDHHALDHHALDHHALDHAAEPASMPTGPHGRAVAPPGSTPPAGSRGRAVLTTIPSDSHSWNLIFIELLLREHGYDVTNLGVCVPVATTLAACQRLRPDLLLVSTVNGHGYLESAEIARTIRDAAELDDVTLILGGLLHPDSTGAAAQVEALRAAGFDHVLPGDAGVATLRALLLARDDATHASGPPGARRAAQS